MQLYFNYSHAQHKHISVNDVPHIRTVVPQDHNITVPLCYNCLQYSV